MTGTPTRPQGAGRSIGGTPPELYLSCMLTRLNLFYAEAEAALADWNGPVITMPLPAVIFQANCIPTARMISPRIAEGPYCSLRNGDANPQRASLPAMVPRFGLVVGTGAFPVEGSICAFLAGLFEAFCVIAALAVLCLFMK